MKKLIIILIVIGAVVGLYFATQGSNVEVTNTDTTPGTETSFKPNPSNATFLFDDGPITLSGGRNERSIAPGSDLKEETSLTEHIAYGDLNDDNRDDTTVLLLRQGGGSGLFIYIASFVSGPSAYKGSNALFVGDRVSPQSLTVSNGVITLIYLDRDPSEPFAAEPTIPTTKNYIFQSGELVER